MASQIIIPAAGNDITEAQIADWLVEVGAPVSKGQPVVEIETDKSAIEIEAEADGVLLAQFYEIGDVVAVHTVIGTIGQPAEEVVEPSVSNPAEEVVEPSVSNLAEVVEPSVSNPAEEVVEPPMSPRARRLVDENPDLGGFGQIVGSGPGGRILESDLLSLGGPVEPAPPADPVSDPEHSYELTGVRRVIAARMTASLAQSAQFTLQRRIDARALLAIRAALKTSGEPTAADVGIGDILAFCTVAALAEHPSLNSTLTESVVIEHRGVHLGIAVDTAHGLVVPVVRDAHRAAPVALAAKIGELAEAAAQRTIDVADLQGGTFTISNLGSFGIEYFTPILNPPQVAVLGVGAINSNPDPEIFVSLTIDHQVVDGAPGARFLQCLASHLETLDAGNAVSWAFSTLAVQ